MRTIRTIVLVVVVASLLVAGLWISSLFGPRTSVRDAGFTALVWRSY